MTSQKIIGPSALWPVLNGCITGVPRRHMAAGRQGKPKPDLELWWTQQVVRKYAHVHFSLKLQASHHQPEQARGRLQALWCGCKVCSMSQALARNIIQDVAVTGLQANKKG